jgi:very-short-patch-repair endonuclease
MKRLTRLEVARDHLVELTRWKAWAKSTDFDYWSDAVEEAKAGYDRLVETGEGSEETPFESIIEARLYEVIYPATRPARLVCQFEIDQFRLDFAFPDYKVGVECDGADFHTSQKDRDYDFWKDCKLNGRAWLVVRLTGSEIYRDPHGCVIDVLETLAQKGFKRVR